MDYKDNNIWLMQGGLSIRMKDLEDNSIDLICADLPYQVTNISWDTIIPFDKLWDEYKRVLKPTGTALLFGVGVFRLFFYWSRKRIGVFYYRTESN